jgi:hypothetical protein
MSGTAADKGALRSLAAGAAATAQIAALQEVSEMRNGAALAIMMYYFCNISTAYCRCPNPGN